MARHLLNQDSVRSATPATSGEAFLDFGISLLLTNAPNVRDVVDIYVSTHFSVLENLPWRFTELKTLVEARAAP